MSLLIELNKAIDQAAYLKHVTYGIYMAASHLEGDDRDAMQLMINDAERQLVGLKTQLYHVQEIVLTESAGGVQ